MTDIPADVSAYWARKLDAMMFDALAGPLYTSNVAPAEDPGPLTADKLLAIARSMPKPPPRVIPIEPFYSTEVYTGVDVLAVLEENPAYHLIPSGKVAHASVPRLRFPRLWSGPRGIEVSLDEGDWLGGGEDEVVFVRADEWRRVSR